MEWGLAGKPSRTGSCSVVTVPIDPQRSPCWLPTTGVSAWSGHRGRRTWQWPIGSMSSSVFGDEPWFQLYPATSRLRVRRLLSLRFQHRCQANRFQVDGGSVHAWGAFHSGTKSPLVLPDRYLTSQFYRDNFRNIQSIVKYFILKYIFWTCLKQLINFFKSQVLYLIQQWLGQ